jgi:hypothetical protein
MAAFSAAKSILAIVTGRGKNHGPTAMPLSMLLLSCLLTHGRKNNPSPTVLNGLEEREILREKPLYVLIIDKLLLTSLTCEIDNGTSPITTSFNLYFILLKLVLNELKVKDISRENQLNSTIEKLFIALKDKLFSLLNPALIDPCKSPTKVKLVPSPLPKIA